MRNKSIVLYTVACGMAFFAFFSLHVYDEIKSKKDNDFTKYAESQNSKGREPRMSKFSNSSVSFDFNDAELTVDEKINDKGVVSIKLIRRQDKSLFGAIDLSRYENLSGNPMKLEIEDAYMARSKGDYSVNPTKKNISKTSIGSQEYYTFNEELGEGEQKQNNYYYDSLVGNKCSVSFTYFDMDDGMDEAADLKELEEIIRSFQISSNFDCLN